jgi:hypothetical protein
MYATVVGTLAALIHICRIIYLFLIYHFEKSNTLVDSIIPITHPHKKKKKKKKIENFFFWEFQFSGKIVVFEPAKVVSK